MSQHVLDEPGHWAPDQLSEVAASDRYWIVLACPLVASLFVAVRLLLGMS